MTTRFPDRSGAFEGASDEADRTHRRETLGTLGTALALVLAMVGGVGAAEAPRVPVSITVGAEGCEPMEWKVPAGVSTVALTDKSNLALE